jgi:hypothetical protein
LVNLSNSRSPDDPIFSSQSYDISGTAYGWTVDTREWIAAMGTHVPLRGEQMVRYYGEFSNCVRGRRRKAEQVEAIPTVITMNTFFVELEQNQGKLQ